MTSKSLASLRGTAAEQLAKYTSPAGSYAFTTYDRQNDVDAPLSPADVLMANLLSLRLTWREVIPLFAEGDGSAQRLRQALDAALIDLRDSQPFESHETPQALEEAVASLAAANLATVAVPGWTAVTVSKVLHRRRPQIVPLIDSRVRTFYGVQKPQKVREALWTDIRENANWMTGLADSQKTPDGRALTLLRLADILIWTP